MASVIRLAPPVGAPGKSPSLLIRKPDNSIDGGGLSSTRAAGDDQRPLLTASITAFACKGSARYFLILVFFPVFECFPPAWSHGYSNHEAYGLHLTLYNNKQPHTRTVSLLLLDHQLPLHLHIREMLLHGIFCHLQQLRSLAQQFFPLGRYGVPPGGRLKQCIQNTCFDPVVRICKIPTCWRSRLPS